MAFENLFIRTKRTIGGIQLDAVINEDHNSTARITSSPVEFGPDVSDGAIIEPSSLTIRGVASDTPLGVAALDVLVDSISEVFGSEISNGGTRSQKAFAAFEALKNNREPIIVSTKLKEYKNMMITSISVSQDRTSSHIADMTISMQEVFITESEIIEIAQDQANEEVAHSVATTKPRGRVGGIEVAAEQKKSWAATITDWVAR